MNESIEKVKRPTSITVICVIGFLGALISVPLIFSPIAQQIGPWYPPYLGFASIVGLVCMIGLWMMKKWAAYTYTGFVALNQIVLLTMGVWNVMALVLPAIVIFFALKHVSKMTA
ncbi:MAG: hypothetical protein WCS55_09950 [Sulfuricurvum sp.]|uniref:hypothetical protein n=1 Tax=Sulfuricurvum sp. TaxID=2025608 RepID=UPI0035649F4C